MNLFTPALRIGAFVMLLWGSAMLLPVLVSVPRWSEYDDFVFSALCCYVLAGLLFYWGRAPISHLPPRSLFMITSFNWLLLCLTGTLPFYFSQDDISFVDSLYESVAGVTTTGSSIFSDVESLPRGLLLWRSLSQWVGGIGIILMAVAVLPSLKVGGMRLFRSEFSEWAQLDGASIRKISSHIILVYILISIACLGAYRYFGMDWFDAVNHTMSTVSTGGFSTYNDSFGHFDNSHLMAVASLFMFLGACPFILVVLSVDNRSFLLWRDSQVQLMFKIVVISTLLLTSWRYLQDEQRPLLDLLESSAFNLISIMTTTGFASEDYGQWGSFAVILIGFLMFSGGCSGSTSGGVKLFRYQLLAIFMREHLQKALHPGLTWSRTYNGRPIQEDVLVSALAYLFLVMMSWFVSSCALAAVGLDPVTAITGALGALMNVGPGLGEVIGPVGNFSTLPDLAKLILSFDMLLGRLEFLALIILFTRAYWKW
jgi:Trk-type K+ transport systems, membrane components